MCEEKEKEELEKDVQKELDHFDIKPRFESLEEFDKFFMNPDSVLKL